MLIKLVCWTVATLAFALSPLQAASETDWRQDLDELVSHVRTTHPDPFLKVGRLTFLRSVQTLSSELPRLTEEQRVVRTMAIMATLGDAHSLVEPRTEAFASWYPLRIVEFTDGYFITAAHESIADLSGAQVISVAGRPVGEVAEAARNLISADNEWWRRESLYAMFNAGMMTGLGFAAQNTGQLDIRVRLRSGKLVERRITPMKFAGQFEPEHASLDWRFGRTEISGPWVRPSQQYVSAFRSLRGDDFYKRDVLRPPYFSLRSLNALPLPKYDSYYIMLNLFQDSDVETLPKFFARAMGEVDVQKPRRLIIDLRENPGGDGSNGGPIVRELIARQRDRPWKELYILVSGRSYSAAQIVLFPLLQNVPATIVGEPMGGSWQMFGDYSTFQLKRIGMELRVSALRHSLSESTDLRTVIPLDYPAPFSFQDYVAGRDPAVDPILAGEEVRSIAVIALADGGAAARTVYLDRRARFSHLPWWAAPTEPELRRVGDELNRAGRTANAIETFRLSSEIHPDEWRSWYNLAEALRADGQKAEALVAYQRCIDLDDPTNFNQAELIDLVGRIKTELARQPSAR